MSAPARIRRHRDQRPRLALMGCACVLVAVAIAVIAFRANDGVPLQSSYRLTVEVPEADRLVKTNDVRIGGLRVGQVQRVTALPAPAGGTQPFARVELRLDAGVGPLPRDTRVTVREGAVLGATYVQLVPGRNRETVPGGGRLPLANASRQVKLTDLLDMFDRHTARAMRTAITSVGDGVAGRGTAMNEVLGAGAQLLPPLQRVSTTLAAPRTALPGFITGASRLFAALRPVGDDLAGAIRGGSVTAGALSARPRALASAIDRLPVTEADTTAALTAAQPALDDLDALLRHLRPSVVRLPASLRAINRVLEDSRPALLRTPRVAGLLDGTLQDLNALVRPASTVRAVVKLRRALVPLGSLLQVLGPAQTQCNAISLWGEGWSSVFGSLGAGNGPAVAALVFTSLGADGEVLQNRAPSPNVAINYLSHQTRGECEANNSPYDGHQALGNPAGLQPAATRPTTWNPDARSRAARAGLLDPVVSGR